MKPKTIHLKRHRGIGVTASRIGSVTESFEFAPSMRISLTSQFRGRRHVLFVGSELRTLPKAGFEMVCELAWSRCLTTSGYLHCKDCDTTRPNPDYFAKLADRVRAYLGGDSLLETGPKRYKLPFLPENIEVCPGILEIRELNPEVIKKVRQVLFYKQLSAGIH